MNTEKTVEIIVTAIGSLGASFAGAGAAFAFGAWAESRKQTAHDIEACNQAMLVIVRQFNFLVNYRRQHLDPLSGQPSPEFGLRPQPPIDMKLWHVNAQGLAFLLGSDAGEAPLEFALQDDRFHIAVTAINAFGNFHIGVFQPALEHLFVQAKRDSLNYTDVVDRLGPRVSQTIRSNYLEVHRHVTQTIKSHETFMAEVVPKLRRALPTGRFISARESKETSSDLNSEARTDASSSGIAPLG